MAKNIKLKIRTSSNTWEQLYPETIVDQVIDASTTGKKLFKVSNPTSNSYVKIATNGDISYLTSAQLLSDISASPLVHQHKISDISVAETVANNYTTKTLVQALDGKADLVGGVVATDQLPSYILGGLKFTGEISSTTTLNSTFFTSNNISTEEKDRGRYFVVTSSTAQISWAADVVMEAPGDDPSGTTSPITLEAGDWLVFVRHDGTNYRFAVLNNTYDVATTTSKGIVQISNSSATSRFDLSSSTTNRYLRMVDEKLLRSTMKDIYYATTEPTNAVTGDILFQEEV
jgi:hypothetical protein